MDRDTIRLEWSEVMLAGVAGIMRQIDSLKNQYRPAHGSGVSNDWQLHIEGCLGEMALSKYLGLRWCGKGSFETPDVGGVDVRTRSQQHYDLILHKKDPDDRKFWLVCGGNGIYTVKGWIMGADGKQERFWKDPARTGRHAYFVPQSELQL